MTQVHKRFTDDQLRSLFRTSRLESGKEGERNVPGGQERPVTASHCRSKANFMPVGLRGSFLKERNRAPFAEVQRPLGFSFF